MLPRGVWFTHIQITDGDWVIKGRSLEVSAINKFSSSIAQEVEVTHLLLGNVFHDKHDYQFILQFSFMANDPRRETTCEK